MTGGFFVLIFENIIPIYFVILGLETAHMKEIRLKVEQLISAQTGTGAFLMVLKEADNPEGRILPIVIGPFEAQAILFGLERHLLRKRPLTHDLMYDMLKRLGYRLDKVLIHKVVEGVFYADIHLRKGDEELIFDARPSDAVALAVRFSAPVFTVPKVLDEAGADAGKAKELDIEMPLQEESAKKDNDPGLDELWNNEIDKFLEEWKGIIEGEDVDMQEFENIGRDLAREIIDFIQKLHGGDLGKRSVDKNISEEDLQKMLDEAIANEDYEKAARIRDFLKAFQKKKGKGNNDGEDNASGND